MPRYVDVKLTDNGTYYDLTIGDDGDFERVNSFDTAILLSLYCERRASESEVEIPEMRRGWIGNYYQLVELGSKMWLLYQARLTQNTLNRCRTYLQQALSWLTDYGYAKQVTVTPTRDIETGRMDVVINIRRNDDEIETLNYALWENTGV